MDPRLRRAWTGVITAADIDAHLVSVGQAEANASLIVGMLAECRTPSHIVFAGAGTGQMFDFAPPAFLAGHRAVFTDINPAFLAQLRQRMPASLVVVDDVEQSALAGPFEAVAAVLLLEHVEWRKAVATIVGWSPATVHFVIQRNPPNLGAMLTPDREVPRTIAEFGRMAHPNLVDEQELSAEMGRCGYRAAGRRERPVADGKIMVGLSFARS